MNVIKNIRLLHSLLDEGQIAKLEAGAALYQRHSRIEFKILIIGEGVITIRTVQTKSPAGNYLSQADLISRTKELFSKFLPDLTINVHAIEYKHAPVEIVTPDWIQSEMLQNKVSLKTLVNDTGIDKSSLSVLVNGAKPLSQAMKGLFYYYFLKKV